MNHPADRNKPTMKDVTGPRQRWPWFLAGFWLVFLTLLFTVKMYSMLPSGQAIVQVSLWQYYLIELRRALTPSNIGPASGDELAVLITFFQHVLVSAVGGGVLCGVGWVINRIRERGN